MTVVVWYTALLSAFCGRLAPCSRAAARLSSYSRTRLSSWLSSAPVAAQVVCEFGNTAEPPEVNEIESLDRPGIVAPVIRNSKSLRTTY